MIQLSGLDTKRLGDAILARRSVQIPGGGGGTISSALVLQVDNGSSVITAGQKGGYIRMPYAGKFTAWTILADAAGSIVIDVWKDAYSAFPPTNADTITGANKPTLAAAQKAQGGVTGWTTTFTADDTFAFNVDSVATVKFITLILKTERT